MINKHRPKAKPYYQVSFSESNEKRTHYCIHLGRIRKLFIAETVGLIEKWRLPTAGFCLGTAVFGRDDM